MENAKARQKIKDNFKDFYEQLCALQNTCPLASVTANLQEGFIDCNADRIRLPDWNPLLDAFKCNNSLKFVALRSFWHKTSQQDEGLLS